MDTEVVLFLRERVPEPALQDALADVFGIAPEAADKPLVVRYAQGFAVGVSIPCNSGLAPENAAAMLSKWLAATVLLESCAGGQWLLFTPEAHGPCEVQVVELRHGLDVLMPVPIREIPTGAMRA